MKIIPYLIRPEHWEGWVQLGPLDKVRYNDIIVSSYLPSTADALVIDPITCDPVMRSPEYFLIGTSRILFVPNAFRNFPAGEVVDALLLHYKIIKPGIAKLTPKDMAYSIWSKGKKLTIKKHKWQTEPLPLP